MELSIIHSRALLGLTAPPVRVETHLSNGLPAFNIVGMPETAVRESRERVRSAIINSHFEFPDRRITISLAPADLPKGGGRFDLPIALGILIASGQVPGDSTLDCEFLGELALDGSLQSVPGTVCAALAASACGRGLVLPEGCADRAACVPDAKVLGASDLLTLCAHLNGAEPLTPATTCPSPESEAYPDLGDVVGQAPARRALEIAACGGHNLLFTGPPGTGKTLLASRLPGILPPMNREEAIVALALRDFANSEPQWDHMLRPFRNPHHTASAAALVGGGGRPLPGEVSLAHGGVLFLDELPEFSRHCLEVLREPMESGQVTLSRANSKLSYPANFQLVAAMNPCPCGFLGDPDQACRCSPEQIQRYGGRVSGPLLDRIDLFVGVPRPPPESLLREGGDAESSRVVRARVIKCRQVQLERQNCCNARLDARQLHRACALGREERGVLQQAARKMHLSGRALHRVMRIARTVADMEEAERISTRHISEALAYRIP